MAPTHPLLQQSQKVKSIKFDEKVSQSINKKKQIPLSTESEICAITTEGGGKKYSIKAGVVGWVIDFNMRLDKEDDLLQNKVLNMLFKEIYIYIFRLELLLTLRFLYIAIYGRLYCNYKA